MKVATPTVVNGSCRYCGKPRPTGYSITCGNSFCQEAAYNDKEKRKERKVRSRERRLWP